MLENLNGWEVIVLALLGLFIFGPERLPKVIGDAMRTIRNLRDMARNATNDLSREIGTEVRLEDLHPKTFIRKHLLSEEDERDLRRPFDDMYQDVRRISSDVTDVANSAASTTSASGTSASGTSASGTSAGATSAGGASGGDISASSAPRAREESGYDRPSGAHREVESSDGGNRPGAHRYDADAT